MTLNQKRLMRRAAMCVWSLFGIAMFLVGTAFAANLKQIDFVIRWIPANVFGCILIYGIAQSSMKDDLQKHKSSGGLLEPAGTTVIIVLAVVAVVATITTLQQLLIIVPEDPTKDLWQHP